MSWVVLFRPEAEGDLIEAQDWYRHRERRLADEFLDAVAIAIRRLEEDPKRHCLY